MKNDSERMGRSEEAKQKTKKRRKSLTFRKKRTCLHRFSVRRLKMSDPVQEVRAHHEIDHAHYEHLITHFRWVGGACVKVLIREPNAGKLFPCS